jgi:hypothetical protein
MKTLDAAETEARVSPKSRTDADHLRWALAFSQLPLHTLREGDWHNLGDELIDFFEVRPVGKNASGEFVDPSTQEAVIVPDSLAGRIVVAPHAPSASMSPPIYVDEVDAERDLLGFTFDEIWTLQNDVKDLFEKIAFPPASPGEEDRGRGISIPASWHVVEAGGPNGAGLRVIFAHADLRDAVLLRILILVDRLGAASIRHCPECYTLFWKQGKRLFCKRQCANKASFRAWAATPKGRTRGERAAATPAKRSGYAPPTKKNTRKKGGSR